jgi:hypothetical protein
MLIGLRSAFVETMRQFHAHFGKIWTILEPYLLRQHITTLDSKRNDLLCGLRISGSLDCGGNAPGTVWFCRMTC